MNQCELYQEIISRLVDGELSRNEYAALDAHMEDCAECSAMYAVFASLSEIIGSEDEPLPEDLHENIMAGVRRSAMINRNRARRRLSKPVRNSLAAAACAALVLFAAKGFDPAEKAQGTMVTKSEAMVMDAAVVEEESPEEIVVESVSEAAPVQAPAAVPAAVPSPAPAVAPTATPAPTRDIYLDPVVTAAPVSTPASVNGTPAPIVVQTPVFVSTPQPAATQPPVQADPAPAAAYEPAPASYEPEVEPAAAAAEAPAEAAAPAAVNELESDVVDESPAMAAAPAAVAEPEETPSAQSRLFGFFGMARPAADESAEESTAEAGPLATESPAEEVTAEETPEAENAVVEEVTESPEPEEKKKPLPVVRIKDIKKLSELEDMIDGTEEKLPEKKADKAYSFCLAEPGEMFKDYKLEVYIIEGKIWYKQIFAEDDFVTCSSKCKLEDFEKFMDSLSDEEKAELIKPSPSPEVLPTESPAPEQNEAK